MGPGEWALMCFAMTTPLALPAVRHVYHNSIRRRRQWAMAVFLSAYNMVWWALGGAVLMLAAVLPVHVLAPQVIAVVMLTVAALWQLSRTKTRALRACTRTVPLPPQGRKADKACLRYGALQAWRCVVTGWPLMLLMALVPVPFVAMAAIAAFMYAEERTRLGRQMARNAAALLAVAAVGVAALG